MKQGKLLFGVFAILCIAQAQAQTADDFKDTFDTFMESAKDSLIAEYERVTAPILAAKESLIVALQSIAGNFQPFLDLATTYSSVWGPFAETYGEVNSRAKSVIEMNGDLAYDVMDLAFQFVDDRARTNLSVAFGQFYAQGLVMYNLLYNGLTNPATAVKAAKCITTNWPKVITAAKNLNTTIPKCVTTAKFDFTAAKTFLTTANNTLKAKYNEFANCVKTITESSSEADIQKAQMCIANAMNLIPYTASKTSVAILNAGISVQDAITVQELKIYACFTPIIKLTTTQMNTLNTTLTTCMK